MAKDGSHHNSQEHGTSDNSGKSGRGNGKRQRQRTSGKRSRQKSKDGRGGKGKGQKQAQRPRLTPKQHKKRRALLRDQKEIDALQARIQAEAPPPGVGREMCAVK